MIGKFFKGLAASGGKIHFYVNKNNLNLHFILFITSEKYFHNLIIKFYHFYILKNKLFINFIFKIEYKNINF